MSRLPETNATVLVLYDMVLQRPLASFKDDALSLLAGAVEFDTAIWASGAHQRNLIFSVATRGVPAHVLFDYSLRWQNQDALRTAVVTQAGRALRNEDLMPEAEHRASAIYRGFCAHHGMEWTLGIAAADPVTTVGELVFLFRGPERRAFTDADRDRLELLAPHLFAAWRQRQSLGLWNPREADPVPPHALVCYAVIDDQGLVQTADASFGAAVRRAFPGWLGPVLPERLRALSAPGSRTVRIDEQRFVARHGAGRHLVRVLGPDREHLTAAELRAARAFAAGATHAEIAALHGLSKATVRNQIAVAYRKLGVHNKVELAAALAAERVG